jgi:ketosteroid isomerase-like protein
MSTTIEITRAFYAAVARGDVPGLLATLHAELTWTEAEGFPYYSGTWTRPQAVVDKLLVPLMRDWEGFSATPAEFIADGDRVIVFGAYAGRARATGRSMRAPFVHTWHVRDGKLDRFDMVTDTWLVRQALVGGDAGHQR